MDGTGEHQAEEGPEELLRSFRWTQRLARRLVRDPGLAADLHQETWTRAIERFGDTIPGRAWLAGTVRSMAYRARRGAARRKLHETQGAQQDPVDGAEEVLMRAEAQQRVAAAVAKLPKDLQIAVLLHFQEGLTIAATAMRLGCSKSAAGERVQRGVAALRRELQAEGSDWRACWVLAAPFGSFQAAASASGAAASISGAAASALGTTALTGMAMKKLVLAGTFVALALMGSLALKLTEPTAELAEAPKTVASAALESPAQNPPKEAHPTAVSSAGKRTPKARPSAPAPVVRPVVRPDDYVLKARVIDASGQPIVRPRMQATAGEWRRESEGSDDGAVELRVSTSELEEIKGKSFNVLISGDIYRTLYSAYIPADGTGHRPPPAQGRVEDFGAVTLSPAGAIHGRGTSTTRRPIAGADVSVCDHYPDEPDSRYGYSGVAPDVLTEEDGTFVVGHLQPGMVSLCLNHPDYLQKTPLSSTEVVAGVTVGPVFLSASPAEIVSGRVLDPNGKPVESVYVNGTNNWSKRDTAQTGADGRFRIALRKGSPAAVQAHFPGWRQVSPPRDALSSAGEMDIVIEPILKEAAFAVAIVDGDTGAHIYRVGVTVLRGGEGVPSGEPEGDTKAGAAPQPMVQPKGGLPMDFVPGVDRLQVAAKGYGTAIVDTDGAREQSPHLTVRLKPTGGVRGRLLENGQPVAGVRVKLMPIEPYVADPRESLRAGGTVRLDTELEEARDLRGESGYAMEPVLGLDGDPPPFRLVSRSAVSGAETSDDGSFRFPAVDDPLLGLVVDWEGRPSRIVRTQKVENGTSDWGDIEILRAAKLTGRLQFNSPWDPAEVALVVGSLQRQVPVAEDGSFVVDGLQPGPVHFSLTNASLMGLPAGLLPFEDDPVFHVDLAPGETRSLVISLDPYAPSSFALDLKIGGKPLAGIRTIELFPVGEPDRVFKVWCEAEGSLVTADTRALGPCRVIVTQKSFQTGWLSLICPGPPLDLRPGHTAEQTIDIPAGRVRMTMDSLHAGAEYGTYDLTLIGSGAPLEIVSVQPVKIPDGESTARRTLLTSHIPPGTYRATLRPSRHKHAPSKEVILAEFDVLIRADEVAEVSLDQ